MEQWLHSTGNLVGKGGLELTLRLEKLSGRSCRARNIKNAVVDQAVGSGI